MQVKELRLVEREIVVREKCDSCGFEQDNLEEVFRNNKGQPLLFTDPIMMDRMHFHHVTIDFGTRNQKDLDFCDTCYREKFYA